MTGVTAAQFTEPIFIAAFKKTMASLLSTPRLVLMAANFVIILVKDQDVTQIYKNLGLSTNRQLVTVAGISVEFNIVLIVQHYGFADSLVAFNEMKRQYVTSTIDRSMELVLNQNLQLAYNSSKYSVTLHTFNTSFADVTIELLKTDFPTGVPTQSPVPVTLGLCLYVTYCMSLLFFFSFSVALVGYKRDSDFHRTTFLKSKKVAPLRRTIDNAGSMGFGQNKNAAVAPDVSTLEESKALILGALPIPIEYDLSADVERITGRFKWSYFDVPNLWIHHRYLSSNFHFSTHRQRFVRTLTTFATVLLMLLVDVVLVLIYSERILDGFDYRWGFWTSYAYDSFSFLLTGMIFICLTGCINSITAPFIEGQIFKYFTANPPALAAPGVRSESQRNKASAVAPSLKHNATAAENVISVEAVEDMMQDLSVELAGCRKDLLEHAINGSQLSTPYNDIVASCPEVQYFDLNWGIGSTTGSIKRNDGNEDSKQLFPDVMFAPRQLATSYDLLGASYRTAYSVAKTNFDKFDPSGALPSQVPEIKSSLRKKIIHLFHLDVMTTYPTELLKNILLRSERFSNPARMKPLQKRAGVSCVLLAITLCMILIFTLSLEMHRNVQAFTLVIFACWLFLDVLIVQSAATLLKHMYLPSWILSETSKVTKWLLLTIQNIYGNNASIKGDISVLPDPYTAHDLIYGSLLGSEWPGWLDFNATQYMFSSSILASKVESFPEAEAVLAFRTIWPKHWLFPHYVMNHGVAPSDVKPFIFQSTSRGGNKVNNQQCNEFIPPAQWMHFDEFGIWDSFVLSFFRQTALGTQDAILDIILWLVVTALIIFLCFVYYANSYSVVIAGLVIFVIVAIWRYHMHAVIVTISEENRAQANRNMGRIYPLSDIEGGASETRPAVLTGPERRVLDQLKNRQNRPRPGRDVQSAPDAESNGNLREQPSFSDDCNGSDWDSYKLGSLPGESAPSTPHTPFEDSQEGRASRRMEKRLIAMSNREHPSTAGSVATSEENVFAVGGKTVKDDLQSYYDAGRPSSVGEWLERQRSSVRDRPLLNIDLPTTADDVTELGSPVEITDVVPSSRGLMSAQSKQSPTTTPDTHQPRPGSSFQMWLQGSRAHSTATDTRQSAAAPLPVPTAAPVALDGAARSSSMADWLDTERSRMGLGSARSDLGSAQRPALPPVDKASIHASSPVSQDHVVAASSQKNNAQLAPIGLPPRATAGGRPADRTASMEEWLDSERDRRGGSSHEVSNSPLPALGASDHAGHPVSARPPSVQDWLKRRGRESGGSQQLSSRDQKEPSPETNASTNAIANANADDDSDVSVIMQEDEDTDANAAADADDAYAELELDVVTLPTEQPTEQPTDQPIAQPIVHWAEKGKAVVSKRVGTTMPPRTVSMNDWLDSERGRRGLESGGGNSAAPVATPAAAAAGASTAATTTAAPTAAATTTDVATATPAVTTESTDAITAPTIDTTAAATVSATTADALTAALPARSPSAFSNWMSNRPAHKIAGHEVVSHASAVTAVAEESTPTDSHERVHHKHHRHHPVGGKVKASPPNPVAVTPPAKQPVKQPTKHRTKQPSEQPKVQLADEKGKEAAAAAATAATASEHASAVTMPPRTVSMNDWLDSERGRRGLESGGGSRGGGAHTAGTSPDETAAAADNAATAATAAPATASHVVAAAATTDVAPAAATSGASTAVTTDTTDATTDADIVATVAPTIDTTAAATVSATTAGALTAALPARSPSAFSNWMSNRPAHKIAGHEVVSHASAVTAAAEESTPTDSHERVHHKHHRHHPVGGKVKASPVDPDRAAAISAAALKSTWESVSVSVSPPPPKERALAVAEAPLLSLSMPPRGTAMQELLKKERERTQTLTSTSIHTQPLTQVDDTGAGAVVDSAVDARTHTPTPYTDAYTPTEPAAAAVVQEAPKSYGTEWLACKKVSTKRPADGASSDAGDNADVAPGADDSTEATGVPVVVVSTPLPKKIVPISPARGARSRGTVMKRFNEGSSDLKASLGEKEAASKKTLQDRLQSKKEKR
jgi:hypothetical protein